MNLLRKISFISLLLLSAVLAFGNNMANDTLINDSKDAKGESLLKSTVIFFQTGQFQPNEKDRSLMVKAIADMKNRTSVSFVISGYTDPSGSSDYNQRLSEKRAEEIKKILIDEGIEESRIMVNSFGESKSENLTQKEFYTMRKVEIKPLIMTK
jgi:OOP family OmpA-OmpF porin